MIMSDAIRITARAQNPDTTPNLCRCFTVPSDKLARMKATAVSGTICGCPGRMLCRTGSSNIQPSNTTLEIKTPNPLTAFGMSLKGAPSKGTANTNGFDKLCTKSTKTLGGCKIFLTQRRKDAKKAFEARQRFAPLRLCVSNFLAYTYFSCKASWCDTTILQF